MFLPPPPFPSFWLQSDTINLFWNQIIKWAPLLYLHPVKQNTRSNDLSTVSEYFHLKKKYINRQLTNLQQRLSFHTISLYLVLKLYDVIVMTSLNWNRIIVLDLWMILVAVDFSLSFWCKITRDSVKPALHYLM